MANEDPAGFGPEDTQSIPIVLPLQRALEGLQRVNEGLSKVGERFDQHTDLFAEEDEELEIPDEAGWKVMPLEEARGIVNLDACHHAHYDPNRQSLVGNDGPSLWFVSGYGPDGTGCTVRVDGEGCHLYTDDRTDTDYRNRLLLKALLHTALGLLEGGDYS